jgi:replication factor C subunit 1
VDKSTTSKSNVASVSVDNQRAKSIDRGSMQWTEKYRPKVPNDIVGNQSMVSCYACSYVGYLY